MENERKEIGLEMVESLMEKKYTLIHVDYRESLDGHPEALAKCLEEKCGDHLNDLFCDWYCDYEGERVAEITEELKKEVARLGYRKWEVEKFFDENEDEIRDKIYDRADNDGITDLLRNTSDIPVRIELLSNYDCINSHWLESSGGYGYQESYFGDMVDALWLNPAKVKKILLENGEKVYGRWPDRRYRDGREQVSYEDFYREMINSCCGANLLTYVARLDPSKLYEAGFDLSKITIPKGNKCGIYSSMQGGGSLLEMQLLRDVVIDLTKNKDYSGYRLIIEVHSRKSYEYTINEVYGVCDSFYGKTIQIQTQPDERLSA